MTVSSWLKLTVSLWLLRKTVKGTGWLLVFAVVIAAWPLTLIVARRVRCWPGGAAGPGPGWAARPPGRCPYPPSGWPPQPSTSHQLRASALAPVRAWEHGWPYPATWLAAAREFALFIPAHRPGRARPGRRAVGVAELCHHHRPGRDHRLRADHLRHTGSGNTRSARLRA